MIKILYICDTMKQRSGVTSVVMNYISHIDRSRVSIDVMAYADSEKEVLKKLSDFGIKVYYMPKIGMKNIRNFILFYNDFFQKHKEYQIVHSHFCQIDNILFSIAKKHGIYNLISHSHNTKYSEYRFKAIRNRILCLNLKRKATVWAACSKAAGKFLYGKSFLTSEKSLLIRNGVECDNFLYDEKKRNDIRISLGVRDEILIGTVGSCKPQKNQEFLLKVMQCLLEKFNNQKKYKLLVVGDGELKEELIDKAKRLNIYESCIFTGVRKDIPEILQAIDIFLLPSLYEGLPVVGIEAQAAGIPCFFSTTITREASLNNVEYLSIKEPELWASKIQNDNRKRDKEAINIVRKNGYDICEETKKIMNYYEEMVKS